MHGESSRCYEGGVSENNNAPPQCPRGSMLCSGGAVANYVYKITDSSKGDDFME